MVLSMQSVLMRDTIRSRNSRKGVDIMNIVDAVSVLGFPVVMALVEFWYIVKKTDEMETLVYNNTQAINQLILIMKGNDK